MAYVGPQRALQSVVSLFQTGDDPTLLPATCQSVEAELSLSGGMFNPSYFQYALAPADFVPTGWYLIEVLEGETTFDGQTNLYNSWYTGAPTPLMSQTEVRVRMSSRSPLQLLSMQDFFAYHRCLTIAATRVLRSNPTLNDLTGFIQFSKLERLERLEDDAYASTDTQRRVLRSQLTLSVQMLEAATGEGVGGGANLPPVYLPNF